MEEYPNIDAEVQNRIKENINRFADREEPLEYDEHYCIFCTDQDIDIPRRPKIKKFANDLVDNTDLRDDISAIIKTPGYDIDENESYFKRNDEGDYPSGKVKYALYLSYVFDENLL